MTKLQHHSEMRNATLLRRIRFIVSTLVGFFSVAAVGWGSSRPNIVLILADDVGQECLGCYGGESYSTPNLDQLARDGMQFHHCYSMPVCHPTRLSLLTGKYPFSFDDPKWGTFPSSAEADTISNHLSAAGYATGVFGKWQLALLRDDPRHASRLGFQHSDIFGWHEGPRYYQPMIYRNGTVRTDTLGHYGPDLYVRGLIEFMKRHRDQPFFAYYSMALCHDVTDDLEAPVPHGPLGRYDSYPEMISEMDRAVGRIVSAVDALGIRDNTLILFLGDNGTPRKMILRAEGNILRRVPVVSKQNGKEVPGGKGTLKDTGTRVPLLASWPGTVRPQEVDDLVDMTDFWPTLLELAGIDQQSRRETEGFSFARRILSNHATARDFAYSQGKNGRCWVRSQNWKLYSSGDLFDMTVDPAEANPVAAEKESDASRSERTRLQTILHRLRPELARE